MTVTRSFEQVTKTYSAEVQRLAAEARKLVFKLRPGCQESVDPTGPYIGYGYAPGYKGLVCTLILSKGGVKLALIGGHGLDDPHG
jgi:hypothetical protein